MGQWCVTNAVETSAGCRCERTMSSTVVALQNPICDSFGKRKCRWPSPALKPRVPVTEFEPFTKSLSTSHIMAEKAYLQLHDKLKNFVSDKEKDCGLSLSLVQTHMSRGDGGGGVRDVTVVLLLLRRRGVWRGGRDVTVVLLLLRRRGVWRGGRDVTVVLLLLRALSPAALTLVFHTRMRSLVRTPSLSWASAHTVSCTTTLTQLQ